MKSVAKDLEIVTLLDFYGEMLTAKQHDFLEYYYNDDLSLSEIAANEGSPVRVCATRSNAPRSSCSIWRRSWVWFAVSPRRKKA